MIVLMSLAGLAALSVIVIAVIWSVMTPRTIEVKHREPTRVKKDLPLVDTNPGTPLVSGEGNEERLSSYIKLSYPNGSIEYRLGEPMTKRKVSNSKRQKISDRDGGACLICGSSGSIEVDHMRALMNGGGNEESNLATLCHKCNSSRKRKFDNSIRRQREKMLKQMKK